VSGKGLDLDELLAGPIPDPELRNVAAGIFGYAKVLLEEEDNLTRIGNLNGVAKDKLRARALELLGVSESEPPEQPDEPDEPDDSGAPEAEPESEAP
jgi:hypothetical protein